jgi:alpha-ribazole phosphatase
VGDLLVTLYVARHAAVTVKGICYGQSDVPTAIDDEVAAGALSAQLATLGVTVARVWSSPWKRARDPAALLAARLAVEHDVDERLSEMSFGAWEGRPYAELEKEPAFTRWMSDWRTLAPPGGETLEALLERARAWRDDALLAPGDALAVTHAGIVRALRARGRAVPFVSVVGEAVGHLEIERVLI